jgi:hypothetical protein
VYTVATAGGGGNANVDGAFNGSNGTVNSGGGGGGRGGNGGKGIVIIAYANTNRDMTIGAGLIYAKTTSGGNKIFTFTDGTGSVSF